MTTRHPLRTYIPTIRQLPILLGWLIMHMLITGLGERYWSVPEGSLLAWAGTGMSLGLVLRYGRLYWVGAIVITFISTILLQFSFTNVLAFTLADGVMVIGACLVIERLGNFRATLARVRDVIIFIVVVAIGATLLGSIVYGVTLYLAGDITRVDLLLTIWEWWHRYMITTLIITPPLITIASNPRFQLSGLNLLSFASLSFMLIVISLSIFGTVLRNFPLGHVLFLFFLFLSINFGAREMSILTGTVSTIALVGTAQNSGPFANFQLDERIFLVWTFVMGVVLTGLLLSAYIHERRVIAARLRRSEQRYRVMFENASIGINISNRNGFPIAVNQAFADMVGYSIEELQQRSFISYTHPDDIEKNLVLFREMLNDKRTHYQLEKRYIRSDKMVVWVSLNSVRFPSTRDDDGFNIAFIEDITERHYAEQNRVQLLFEKERSDILTSFIQKASHEFRTPLGMINGYLYLVEHGKTQAERTGAIQSIGEQVNEITLLVESLTKMSRLDMETTLELQHYNLAILVQSVAGVIQYRASQKGIDVTIDTEQVVECLVDIEEFSAALHHIVDNAVKFSEAGDSIIMSLKQDNEVAVIAIQDTGVGMGEETLPYIFNRFYRQDEAHTTRGFGLGLPIAKKIIEAHGGTLTVSSVLGEGTTFTIRMPIAPNHEIPHQMT